MGSEMCIRDSSGAIGEKVRREPSDSYLVRRIWESVRDLRDVHGVSEEAMANIVPESWRDRAFRAGEQGASGQSIADILPAHDAESTSSNKAQYRLGKLVNRVRYDKNVTLKQLPEKSRGAQATTRGKGDERFRQSPAKKSMETRCHCLFEGATGRLVSGHSSVVIRVRGTALSGERGVPGDEVPLPRCDGREHAACAFVSSIGRAGQPASALGTRAIPNT